MEPIIIRCSLVTLRAELALQVEYDNGDMADLGVAFSDERDEVGVLQTVARICTGMTADAAGSLLNQKRAQLFRDLVP